MSRSDQQGAENVVHALNELTTALSNGKAHIVRQRRSRWPRPRLELEVRIESVITAVFVDSDRTRVGHYATAGDASSSNSGVQTALNRLLEICGQRSCQPITDVLPAES